MTWHPGNALHIKYALRWDVLPLGNGLGAYFAGQRLGKAGIAPDGPFGLRKRLPRNSQFIFHVDHAGMKAQLSHECKHIFR